MTMKEQYEAGNFNQTLTLSDGRRLGYAEYGAPDGTPVFYCHGSPGSRLDLANMDELLSGANTRLIAPDRPGIGLSDFNPDYQLVDWPDDLIQLADALALARFAVMGLSGGGPFCAASAYRFPDRVKKAAIVSGLSSLDTPGMEDALSDSNKRIFDLARRANWQLRLQYWLMGRGLQGNPDRVMKEMKKNLPAPDRVLLEEKPEELRALLNSMSEALRSGSRGVSYEWSLYARPWGFQLEEIAVPVDIWHGEADMNAPVIMGRQMVQTIPQARAHFLPDEGHISLFANHMEEILAALLNK
jgi:pimeloyl-ACP methyl ester carboxylesterase